MLLNQYPLIVFFEAFLCSVGNLSAFTGLAGKFHFLGISSVCFDKFFAIMAEKDDTASIRIKGYLLFSVGRDIDEIAFDTVKTSIFMFWCWDRCWSCIRHIMQL